MANQIEKLNGIEIASIEKLNGLTDANIEKLNGLEFAGITDAHTLIKTETADSDAVIQFLDGTGGVVMDNTYDIYEFHFTNMHPVSAGSSHLQVQANASGGSGFNEYVISSTIASYHAEHGYNYNFQYEGWGQSNTQSYTIFSGYTGTGGDESVSGVFTLFDPSNTDHVTHFYARTSARTGGTQYNQDVLVGGYFNVAAAIDEISFKFSTGSTESGEIKMYGVATS